MVPVRRDPVGLPSGILGVRPLSLGTEGLWGHHGKRGRGKPSKTRQNRRSENLTNNAFFFVALEFVSLRGWRKSQFSDRTGWSPPRKWPTPLAVRSLATCRRRTPRRRKTGEVPANLFALGGPTKMFARTPVPRDSVLANLVKRSGEAVAWAAGGPEPGFRGAGAAFWGSYSREFSQDSLWQLCVAPVCR